jgi:hypothetical protein
MPKYSNSITERRKCALSLKETLSPQSLSMESEVEKRSKMGSFSQVKYQLVLVLLLLHLLHVILN